MLFLELLIKVVELALTLYVKVLIAAWLSGA
jgi:hypothetical protein